jgi:hypothetical protein
MKEKKVCIKCKVPKELEDFSSQKFNSDGMKKMCKLCTREIANEKYRLAKLEKELYRII